MDTVAPSPGGLEPRARQQDRARPARIDMPAAQADAGSRNANKAGWRGLLRAGARGQAGGSPPGGEACRGAWGLAGPSLVSLEPGLLGRPQPLAVTWPSTASRLLLVGQRRECPGSEVRRISPWTSGVNISRELVRDADSQAPTPDLLNQKLLG